MIAKFAASAGVSVVEEFTDEGVSGTRPLADRPGLSALLARILGNGVRVVLVEKADRLARDLERVQTVVRETAAEVSRALQATSATSAQANDKEQAS